MILFALMRIHDKPIMTPSVSQNYLSGFCILDEVSLKPLTGMPNDYPVKSPATD